MILPNKHLSVQNSLIGTSSMILMVLKDNRYTVDRLWLTLDKKYNKTISSITYSKYLESLYFMYITNMIRYNDKGEILK